MYEIYIIFVTLFTMLAAMLISISNKMATDVIIRLRYLNNIISVRSDCFILQPHNINKILSILFQPIGTDFH